MIRRVNKMILLYEKLHFLKLPKRPKKKKKSPTVNVKLIIGLVWSHKLLFSLILICNTNDAMHREQFKWYMCDAAVDSSCCCVSSGFARSLKPGFISLGVSRVNKLSPEPMHQLCYSGLIVLYAPHSVSLWSFTQAAHCHGVYYCLYYIWDDPPPPPPHPHPTVEGGCTQTYIIKAYTAGGGPLTQCWHRVKVKSICTPVLHYNDILKYIKIKTTPAWRLKLNFF